MRKVTASQFLHIGDGVCALRDDESIRVDIKEPSRVVEDTLARNHLFCANLGSFYYQLRKRAGLLGTGRRGSRSPAIKDTLWHRAVSDMNELLALITSNIEQGRVELAESNLEAIYDVAKRLIEAGQEYVGRFKPLVEEKKQIKEEINALESHLSDRVKLAFEFTPEQIDHLVSMNFISERDAQAAKQLQILRARLSQVEERLRLVMDRRPARTRRRLGKRVRLADLLQTGIIAPGTVFRLRGTEILGTIMDSGQLEVAGKLFDAPSPAAEEVLGGSRAGWHYWEFQDTDGKWKLINELRQGLTRD